MSLFTFRDQLKFEFSVGVKIDIFIHEPYHKLVIVF